MNNFILSNNVSVPAIGFGTLQMESGEQTVNSIKSAVSCGYRHIDSAEVYGNDESVGEGIRQCGIPREELFVTSKLSNDNRGYENALNSFNDTLKRMKLSYLDLYLIHWPLARGSAEECRKVNSSTWKALEHLYKEGFVKAIGISNFWLPHLSALLPDVEIKPMVNQIEIHPGFPQSELVSVCQKENILVEAWSPLGQGKMLDNATLKSIAAQYGKSVAQLCLKWCLQRDILPLPKSVNPVRMKENLDVFDFTISDNDMNQINTIEYFGGSGLNPDTVPF